MLHAQNGATDAELRHDEYGHVKHGNLGDLVKLYLRESQPRRRDPGRSCADLRRDVFGWGSGGSDPSSTDPARDELSGELATPAMTGEDGGGREAARGGRGRPGGTVAGERRRRGSSTAARARRRRWRQRATTGGGAWLPAAKACDGRRIVRRRATSRGAGTRPWACGGGDRAHAGPI